MILVTTIGLFRLNETAKTLKSDAKLKFVSHSLAQRMKIKLKILLTLPSALSLKIYCIRLDF